MGDMGECLVNGNGFDCVYIHFVYMMAVYSIVLVLYRFRVFYNIQVVILHMDTFSMRLTALPIIVCPILY